MASTTCHVGELQQASASRGVQGAAYGLIAQGASKALNALYTWRARAIQRRHLRSLDDRILKDIGVSRAQAAFEATKPFWKP